MAATVSATALPPSFASSAALSAIFSVCWALSAFCLMLETICSMEEETSSAEAACSVAPWDICSEVELICWLPDATLSAALCHLADHVGKLLHHCRERLHQLVLGGTLLDSPRGCLPRSPWQAGNLFIASMRTFRLFLIVLKSPL